MPACTPENSGAVRAYDPAHEDVPRLRGNQIGSVRTKRVEPSPRRRTCTGIVERSDLIPETLRRDDACACCC